MYGEYIDESVPKYEQPDKIKIQLKPHQLAGIKKAYHMEQDESFAFSEKEDIVSYVRSSIGIIGEKVGYGKTITVLGLIAASSTDSIYVSKENIRCHMNNQHRAFTSSNIMTIKRVDNKLEEKLPNYINTTLVIVPRGPVFTQWEKAITTQTKLKHLSITDIRTIRTIYNIKDTSGVEAMKAYLEKYDLVLIKNTSLKKMFDILTTNCNTIVNWARIVMDEAHEMSSTIPYMNFKFIWFVTASYYKLFWYRNFIPNSMSNVKNALTSEIKYILIKSKETFIKQSFELPEMKETFYECYMPPRLNAVRHLLSKSVLDRLNASDLEGAVREMGGKTENEQTIIDILTEKLNRDLRNKKKERLYVQDLDISQVEKKSKLSGIDMAIKHYQSQLDGMTERLNNLDQKMCSICLDIMVEPIILNCSHSYCGMCLFQWIKQRSFCPECKQPMDNSCMIKLNNNMKNRSESNEVKQNKKKKEEIMIDIIKKNPNGKYLIFSKIENGFSTIIKSLQDNNIVHTEIKGNTHIMNNILNRFKDGEINVILLNTHHAGSGIDLSFATDVIIYHVMSKEDKTQAIGRAYRVGREQPLNVHHLIHENEQYY